MRAARRRGSRGSGRLGWGLCLAGLGLGCAPADPADPGEVVQIGDGDYSLWTQTGRAPRIELRRHDQPLLRLAADGIELGTVGALDPHKSYDPYWLDGGNGVLSATPPEDLVFRPVSSAAVVERDDGAERLVLALTLSDGVSARLTLERSSPGRFAATVTPDVGMSGLAVAYLRLRAQLTGDEHEGLYGLGEWADQVNHRGQVRPMQLEVDSLESANNENRVPVPLLIGTRGWGLFVETRRVGVFDVAHKQADAVEATFGTAEQSGQGLRFHLFAAEQPLDVLRRYYDVAGDPLLPARWAYGPWIWRDESRDQAQVLDDIAKIRSLDLATSAIWLDRPYANYVNSFNFDPARITDPAKIVAAAHAAGLRMALWHAPYLEEKAQPFRGEAEAKGYFPVQSGLLLNNWSAPIDYTNPKAFAAWQGWLAPYIQLGVEGFKLDYGEDVAPSFGDARNVWQFADGSDERTAQYSYTLAYHRAYAELVPSPAAGGGFLLCRGGRWGDQKQVSVIWPGDMDATFTHYRERFAKDGKMIEGVGGLPATVVQGLSLSASGFPFFASDTGGFRHSPPDKELFIRWFEQTSLAAAMEIGDASSQTPWEYTPDNGRDDETLDLYRRYTRLHLRLFPYAWTYAENMRRDGHPILRPFGLAYPALGVHPSDQYLFGEDLLVAPVLERGATSRQVVLPPGGWVDFWDGTVYDGKAGGSTVSVPAPLDRLPLLVRQGALVPMLRPTIDTLAPATDAGVESFANDPGVLYVLVVPGPAGATSSFTLFDGTLVGQETAASGSQWTLRLQSGAQFQQGAMFQWVGSMSPTSVTVDGKPLAQVADLATLEKSPSGWTRTTGVGAALWIRIPGASSEQHVQVN